MNDIIEHWNTTTGWQFGSDKWEFCNPITVKASFCFLMTAEQILIANAVIEADALTGQRFETWAEFVAANSDAAITHLYNSGATTQAIAYALGIKHHQAQDAIARLRPSGVLTKRKRTTEAEARQLLTEAGADFTALAAFAPEVWQPEAARLLDAGIAPSQLARFTAVSASRVHAWAKGREVQS